MRAIFTILMCFVFTAWLVTPSAVAAKDAPLCASVHTQIANAARYTASAQTDIAVGKLTKFDAPTKALLKRWFGKDDAATRDQVKSVLIQSKGWMDKVVFYCQYQSDKITVEELVMPSGQIIMVDGAEGLFAYVRPSDMTRMVLGLAFFKAPEVGHDSRFGTIIHEMTHYWLTGNTDDHAVGLGASLALAKSDTARALQNADSYQYFVEEAAP
jgi:Lysine-specific metallo-endopeptidase